ncbi:efflux RND transporter periplasmic adaptor subunit [Paenibacillus sp.]|uniref:efflux RND transporter periplasmic adaptor subunit n=1 Tax=Paenibacillus sp. TaxID=58172 RepID=UPI0028111F39|nr:efflux RND transporter periplasmic adaptor subunit [Paenibacillus sp.]
MIQRKRTLRWLIGLFFAALLTLTFLSNTIQSLSLPKVSVETPELGALERSVSGEGFLRPAQTASLYPQGDWTVEAIHKRDGDRVRKGDPLIDFDTESTRRALQDEKTRYEQKKLQMEKLLDQMKTALRDGDTTGTDNQKRDLQVMELDMDIQRRSIADLERRIAEGGTLTAPFDGVVTKVNASEGASVGRSQPVVELADDASGYSFDFTADSDDASALQVGAAVKVWLDETPRRSVAGLISDIEDASEDGSLKTITIEVGGPGLEPGKRAFVDVSQMSDARGVKIPKSTLKSDSGGDYVFTVAEEDGPLGTAYYVRATYVTVQEENGDTAVVEGLMPTDRVVAEASEPIDDGDRVRY